MAWILLGVAGLLIVGNAVFVAAETALVTVDRNLVESRAREGSVRFGRVRGALQRLSTYLSGAQLGITVTSLAIGLVAEPSLATLLRGPLEALGLDADVTEVAAIALTLLLATAVQMVFGELVPKNIALSRPADSVVWVVVPLLVFTKVTRPLDCGAERLGESAAAPRRGGAGGGAALCPYPGRVGIGGAASWRAGGVGFGDGGADGTLAGLWCEDRRGCHDATHPRADGVGVRAGGDGDRGHPRHWPFPFPGDRRQRRRHPRRHARQASRCRRSGGSHYDTHPRGDDRPGPCAAFDGAGPATRSAARNGPATGGSCRRVRRHGRDRHLRRPGGGACRRRC